MDPYNTAPTPDPWKAEPVKNDRRSNTEFTSMKTYQRFTENGKTYIVIAVKRNGKIRVREILADKSYGPSIDRGVPGHMAIEDLTT